MDLIATLLGEQTPQLVSALTSRAGLSQDEAERFVPEAAQATVSALQECESDEVNGLLEGEGLGSLLGKLGVLELASSTKVGESKVTAGLRTLVPLLLGMLKSKGGSAQDLLSPLSGQQAGGLLSAVRRFLGR
jgi:hypothetical protein